MKQVGSKIGEMSVKDIGNVLFLALSFLWGFYIANTEMVNQLIGQYLQPEHVGIATTFIAYFFKQLLKDNSQTEKQ